MGRVNRFMQPVSPVIINPISIEQFSMVPLAKAEAKAMGVQALSTYKLPYNVDKKDQNYISGVVSQIDQGKEKILNRMLSEGVSENLITDFVNLKDVYKGAKLKVQQAETNKALIDQWKKEVFHLHGNDPVHMQRVLDKEYELGWNGTFDENGNMQTFDKSRGPKSFSITDDFIQGLSGVSPTEIEELTKRGGSYFTTEILPDNSIGTVLITTDGKKVYSNESKLVSRFDSIIKEYMDKGSQRGSFVDYIGMPLDRVRDIGTDVLNSYISKETRGGDYHKSLVDKVTPPPEPPEDIERVTIDVALNDDDIFNVESDIGEYSPGTAKILSRAGTFFSGLWELGKGLATADPVGFWKNVTEQHKEQEAYEKSLDTMEEDKDAARIAAGEIFYKDWFRNNREIEAYTKKHGTSIPLDKSDQDLTNKVKIWSTRNKQYFDKNGKMTSEGYKNFYKDVVLDYYGDTNFDKLVTQTDIYRTSTLFDKKLGLKNDPEGAALDLKAVIQAGGIEGEDEYSNRVVMGLTSKKLVKDTETLSMLQSGLDNVNKSIKEGEYKAVPIGSTTSDPRLYRTRKGGKSYFVKNLAFGKVYNIVDYEGKSQGQYIVGNGTSITSSPEYQQLEGTLEKLSNIAPGTSRDATFKGAKIKVGMAAYTKLAYDNTGRLVPVPKGNYYVEAEAKDEKTGRLFTKRYVYDQNYLEDLKFVE